MKTKPMTEEEIEEIVRKHVVRSVVFSDDRGRITVATSHLTSTPRVCFEVERRMPGSWTSPEIVSTWQEAMKIMGGGA